MRDFLPFGCVCSSGISAMISSISDWVRASRRASRSAFMRRMKSSVRARTRSFNLADAALRRTESGEPVRALFEGLLFSGVTGSVPCSSTQAEPQ